MRGGQVSKFMGVESTYKLRLCLPPPARRVYKGLTVLYTLLDRGSKQLVEGCRGFMHSLKLMMQSAII